MNNQHIAGQLGCLFIRGWLPWYRSPHSYPRCHDRGMQWVGWRAVCKFGPRKDVVLSTCWNCCSDNMPMRDPLSAHAAKTADDNGADDGEETNTSDHSSCNLTDACELAALVDAMFRTASPLAVLQNGLVCDAELPSRYNKRRHGIHHPCIDSD